MDDNKLLIKAICLAKHYHAGQTDLSGQHYIKHPLRVAKAVIGVKEKIVAVLHDILEDTPIKEDQLKRTFSKEIVEAVRVLTHRKEEQYRDYIRRIAENRLATLVKIADLQDNLDPRRDLGNRPEDVERRARYQKALNFLNSQKTPRSS